MNAKFAKLIRQYAKIVGIKDPKLIERVFSRGDIYQKKRDLIAMRATIFAKRNIKPGTSYEEQQKIMEKFVKTQDLRDARFPKIKDEQTTDNENGHNDSEGSKKVSRLSMPKSNLSSKSKLGVGAYNNSEHKTHEVELG